MRPVLLSMLLLSAGCAHSPRGAEVSDAYAEAALKPFAGEVVLLDFWATWCEPCRVSFPRYAVMHEELSQRGFRVVAVSVDTEPGKVQAHLAENPVPFTVLEDPTAALAQKFGVETLPTALVLGRDGKVVLRHRGFVAGDEQALRAAIESALGAQGREPSR